MTGEAAGVLNGSLALEPKRRPPQGAQRPQGTGKARPHLLEKPHVEERP